MRQVPGLTKFKGGSMHTANWDTSVDLKVGPPQIHQRTFDLI